MSDQPSDWKARILTAVVFLLFLIDLGEFVAWKVERIIGVWLHH